MQRIIGGRENPCRQFLLAIFLKHIDAAWQEQELNPGKTEEIDTRKTVKNSHTVSKNKKTL